MFSSHICFLYLTLSCLLAGPLQCHLFTTYASKVVLGWMTKWMNEKMSNLVTEWIVNCLPWRSELMAYLDIPRPPWGRFRRRSASFPNCGKDLFIWRFTTWIWAVLFCSWPRRSTVLCCECTVSSRTPTFLRDLSRWFAWTVFISAPEWLQFPDRNVSRGDKWASGPCVALITCVLGAERLHWSLPAPGQPRPASRDGGNAGICALGWATAHVWGCQTFSVKGQVINISGFVGFAGLYHNSSLHSRNTKADADNT